MTTVQSTYYGCLGAVTFVCNNVIASHLILQLPFNNDHWIEFVLKCWALLCSLSATTLLSRGCTAELHVVIGQWWWLTSRFGWLLPALYMDVLSQWTCDRFMLMSAYLGFVMLDTRHWTWTDSPRAIDLSSLPALLMCTPAAYSAFIRLYIKYQSRVLDSIQGVPVLYLCILCTLLGVVNSREFHAERHAKTLYSALWVANIGFLFFLAGEPMPELRYLIGIVGINLFLFETIRQ